jgi:hypothetical protein
MSLYANVLALLISGGKDKQAPEFQRTGAVWQKLPATCTSHSKPQSLSIRYQCTLRLRVHQQVWTPLNLRGITITEATVFEPVLHPVVVTLRTPSRRWADLAHQCLPARRTSLRWLLCCHSRMRRQTRHWLCAPRHTPGCVPLTYLPPMLHSCCAAYPGKQRARQKPVRRRDAPRARPGLPG